MVIKPLPNVAIKFKIRPKKRPPREQQEKMFGAWSKSAPACGKATNTKHILDEQAKKALTTKQNSSGLYPGLAIIHNDASRDSGAHILSLPNTVLVKICRLATVSDAEITVSASNPALCKEPYLVEACKDLRAIARPVFYRESVFKCSVSMFKVMALQPWVNMREKAMEATSNLNQKLRIDPYATYLNPTKPYSSAQRKQVEYMADHVKKRKAPQLPQPTELSWVVDDVAHWANLVDWLKLYHQGGIGGYGLSEGEQPDHQTLMSVFGIVRVLRGQPWSLVSEVVGEARVALTAVDAAWGTNGEEMGQDVDMANAGGVEDAFDNYEESDDDDDLN